MTGTVATMPRVSVVMNCLNCQEFVREALDSVLAQSCPDWEIIFLDNASQDASGAIVQGYGDPRIRYCRGEQTVPLGAARNLAIAQARGEFIAFLDCDDRWLPEKLVLQLDYFERHPEADFVYGNYFRLLGGERASRPALKGEQPSGLVFAAFLRHYPVNLQTVLLRHSALEALGGMFDLSFEVSEEYDLFMRLLLGREAGYIDQPLVEYRIHAGMASVRRMDLYPVEYSLILERLRKLVPDFDSRYREELRMAQAKLAYYRARSLMARDERVAARMALRPALTAGAIYRALYVATFLPNCCWKALMHLKLRFL